MEFFIGIGAEGKRRRYNCAHHGISPARVEDPLRECAFCENSAKMSAEHLFGSWITDLFPNAWESRLKTAVGDVTRWRSKSLDWKAKVVCETCNNTWMSDIENLHAKPVMTPLITGEIDIPIGYREARSLALYSFKAAIITDMSRRHREPFFSRRIRHAFRNGLNIPQFVNMWMCAYVPGATRVDFEFGYHKGYAPSAHQLQLNVLTCGIGCFAFQVVSVKHALPIRVQPAPGFETLAQKFWPAIPDGFVWPRMKGLRSIEELLKFHHRWDSITLA